MTSNAKRTGFFFARLAAHNLWRNRQTTLPYLVCAAEIFGVFLLISGLMFSETLKNLPTGGTASLIFAFGLAIFAVFAFCFMLYVNRYLIGQRKREFGLYGILGLSRRHVGRVLLWENLLVLGAGLAIGLVIALVFGRLLFWILLKVIRATPGSTFSLAPRAYLFTAVLFAALFIATSLINLRQVRLSSPAELLRAQREGEKESRALWPIAALGLAALLVAYYFAWTIDSPSTAMFAFWGLVLLVIFATFALCTAGSVVLLKRLRADKCFYYQPTHFVTVSGLLQRMRQHARSLAVITIVSVMLVVAISGTLALYLGQEKMMDGMYPYDVLVSTAGDPTEDEIAAFEQTILSLAEKRAVTLSADPARITHTPPEDLRLVRNNYMAEGERAVPLTKLLYFGSGYRFDASGTTEDCLAMCDDIRNAYRQTFPETPKLIVSEVFSAKQDGYGLYGGLLFLGAFFGLLFLSITALLIYFKQITEGYEDRERFVILQKVGMDDAMVRGTINRQVLTVFFIPLGVTMLHMVFASRIMARMLQMFMLYEWGLVLACIGGTLLVFAALYLVIYRLTARVYYRIVKW